MNESALTIGENTQLVGIFTESQAVASEKPTILLLNSGLLGRIGPFRLHVMLARKFAKLGFNTFRFDLSGIGDSERHTDKSMGNDIHLNDIKQVMDYLNNKNNINNFIIMGICTGADNAHKTMLKDERVLGAVCIDGYTFPTYKYYLNYYLPKFFNFKIWWNKLNNILNTSDVEDNDVTESPDKRTLSYKWILPEKNTVESDYSEFINRNVKLLCLYTSTWRYNYTSQLSDAFPSLDFSNNIQLAYHSSATHTFPTIQDRELLSQSISEWLTSNFK